MHYLITGGVRSGKTAYGQKLAQSLSPSPVYLATSRVWDQNFADRIKRHQLDRDSSWTNYEIEKFISQIPQQNQVILLDCITLWLTNFFTDHSYQLKPSLQEAKKEMEAFLKLPNTVIFITNEIGMGGHAETEIGRNFADLQGWFNQYLASRLETVVMMVSGIPLTVKE